MKITVTVKSIINYCARYTLFEFIITTTVRVSKDINMILMIVTIFVALKYKSIQGLFYQNLEITLKQFSSLKGS